MKQQKGIEASTPILLATGKVTPIRKLPLATNILTSGWNKKIPCFTTTTGIMKELGHAPLVSVNLLMRTLTKSVFFSILCTPDTRLLVTIPQHHKIKTDFHTKEIEHKICFMKAKNLTPTMQIATEENNIQVQSVYALPYTGPVYKLETDEGNYSIIHGIIVES